MPSLRRRLERYVDEIRSHRHNTRKQSRTRSYHGLGGGASKHRSRKGTYLLNELVSPTITRIEKTLRTRLRPSDFRPSSGRKRDGILALAKTIESSCNETAPYKTRANGIFKLCRFIEVLEGLITRMESDPILELTNIHSMAI